MISRARIMTVVLVLSLALNLLIVGGITKRIMDRGSRPIPPNIAWIIDNLDEETKAKLRPRFEEYGDATRPYRRAIFRAQRDINDLLLEEPMNQQALAAAFDHLRQASLEYQEVSHEQTIHIFEVLTPEQRAAALSFMQNRRDPARRNRDEHR